MTSVFEESFKLLLAEQVLHHFKFGWDVRETETPLCHFVLLLTTSVVDHGDLLVVETSVDLEALEASLCLEDVGVVNSCHDLRVVVHKRHILEQLVQMNLDIMYLELLSFHDVCHSFLQSDSSFGRSTKQRSSVPSSSSGQSCDSEYYQQADHTDSHVVYFYNPQS